MTADLTILVPSSYRPEALRRCLDAISRQTVAPRAVVVTLRPDDIEGERVCLHSEPPGPGVVHVVESGLIVARKAGLDRANTAWVAFLDDDAEPAPDWCERALPYLGDPSVGCLGGRIIDFHGARTTARWIGASVPIARVDAFGRLLSHLHDIPEGRGRVEDVDFLPGSNLFIRAAVARLADHGRAPGLAPGEELEWCMTAQDSGLRVVYDSSLVVAHYPAARRGATARHDKVGYAFEYAYMMSYVLARHRRGPRRALVMAYSGLVGARVSPGLLLLAPCLARPGLIRRWTAATKGRIQGWADARRSLTKRHCRGNAGRAAGGAAR